MREAVPADLPDVLQLIRTLKRSLSLVLREVQAALGAAEEHSGWLRAYVACWQEQIVGLAVIRLGCCCFKLCRPGMPFPSHSKPVL